jgi:ABC-type lipoprotein export system ATPase subunit
LPKGDLRVFEGLDFELRRGELAAVMGASGVGKTTLLNLLGGLDRPTEGRVLLDGEDMFGGTDRDVASVRNRKIGFVFQVYHLLPEFTALENVSFPLMIGGLPKKQAFLRAAQLLREVGLEDKTHSRPSQLSGGEQQRVAIARSLVNGPCLLLADEPTGNLDWKTGERVLRLVLDLHASKGLSSILVTHNEKIARFCHKVYMMDAGTMKLLASPPS